MVMEFITGMLLASTLFLLYDKLKKPVKHVQESLEDEKEKEYIKHFDDLLNYTPEKAYRKV